MRKYSNADIADIIEDEGLGYAITDYVYVERIEDPTMRALWEHAHSTLGTISRLAFDARRVREGG